MRVEGGGRMERWKEGEREGEGEGEGEREREGVEGHGNIT